jgi:hypothetical protein
MDHSHVRARLSADRMGAAHDGGAAEGGRNDLWGAVRWSRQRRRTCAKRGPPPTGRGTPIVVRMQPPDLSALDEWAATQTDKPSRPEAVRRLLAQALKEER